MFKLTKKMVEEAKPHSVIFKGTGLIEHPWFNDARPLDQGGNLESDFKSTKVNFVVFRGGIADWCIYHSLDANLEPSRYLDGTEHLNVPHERVALHGAKLHREDQILRLIKIDDGLMELYRH